MVKMYINNRGLDISLRLTILQKCHDDGDNDDNCMPRLVENEVTSLNPRIRLDRFEPFSSRSKYCLFPQYSYIDSPEAFPTISLPQGIVLL